MHDLDIRAASIEDAIASLGTAEEFLEGCGCEDDLFAITETKEHLKTVLAELLGEVAEDQREDEEALTRHYYRER